MQPTILTIAGSDSSGGAGIQADLKAIAANGGYGASVVTAITAQNTCEVSMAHCLDAPLIAAQMDAVFDDLRVSAVKTGMLGSEGVVAVVSRGLRVHRPPHYVCDPVMISKTGYALLPREATGALVRELLPLADLLTPNVHEARELSGLDVGSLEDGEMAARRILRMGPKAVLLKGGHLDGDPATDLLVTPGGSRVFRGEWFDTPHTHGTGCTYSAAIATQLGRGLTLEEAVATAKEFMGHAIRGALQVGRGRGPTDPFFFLRARDDGSWLRRIREKARGS